MKKVMVWLIATCAFLAVLPVTTAAQRVTMKDPKDTKGKMDVRQVRLWGQDKLVWRIDTYKPYTANDVWDRGYAYVFLDLRGDSAFEHYLLVRSRGRRMNAALFRLRPGRPDRRVAGADVWRKGRRSVSVRIPSDRLPFGGQRTHWRFHVRTSWTRPNCPRTCLERVPNKGAVRLPVPGREPEPEPEPIPARTLSPVH